VYGVDIESDATLRPGVKARLVFKYPVHFSAPAGARATYGSNLLFERSLTIAYLVGEGRYRLLPSARPAADNLETTLTATGSYLIVAPR
jgi:hypothetical protein